MDRSGVVPPVGPQKPWGANVEKSMIEFRSFPALFYWKKGIFAASVILFVVYLTFVYSGNPVFPMIAFLVLTMPLVNFLFPSKYCFSGDRFLKMQLFNRQEFRYDDFKAFHIMKDGLLPIKKKGKSGDFIYVFDRQVMKELTGFLKEKVPFG